MKTCTKCTKEKDEADFYNDKKSKDGKCWRCKECMNVVTMRNLRAKRPPKKDWSTDPDFKICRKCLANKPVAEFNLHHGTRDKLRNECKDCQKAHANQHYKTIAVEERKKRKVHYKNNFAMFQGYHLKRLFNISVDEYEKMMDLQDRKCAICGTDQPTGRGQKNFRLSVDHDHETGRIRGLLCHNCNVALGNFRDSPTLLQQAIDYLTL